MKAAVDVGGTDASKAFWNIFKVLTLLLFFLWGEVGWK